MHVAVDGLPRLPPYLPATQLSFTFPTVQDTTDVQVSAPATPVLLHWVMWQDRDGSGQRAASETLDLMPHDRVV